MDFSTLQYEIQFEYLLNLPFQEILKYCQTSRTADAICQDSGFWSSYLLKKYGIQLENPNLDRVKWVERSYLKDPMNLAHLLLISPHPKAREVFWKGDIVPDPRILEVILDAIALNDSELLANILDRIHSQTLEEEEYRIMDEFLREPYYETISRGLSQMTQILGHYYDASCDNTFARSKIITQAIERRDYNILDFLFSIVRPRELSLSAAIIWETPDVIEHYLDKFPNAFDRPIKERLRKAIVVSGYAVPEIVNKTWCVISV